jgi:RHS repeat-associated protein
MRSYHYGGVSYANPHASTQLSNGYSTTTYAYDNNGNVTQKTTDGTTTTYVWDYTNRLIALGSGGATTTYGYDAFGARVLQTGTSTTMIYPFKWYSVASSTGSGAKFATTTEYAFNGDTLLATVDRQLAAGTATGTAKTRYIHPDHLGSTNVVTDENDNLVQTLDYYPYGATRISSATSTNERRKWIGQFLDDSNLEYLNARYYSPSQGQFLTEDPVFWGKQNLSNPQSLNSARTMGGLNSAFASGWNQDTQSRGPSIFSAEYLADPQSQNSYAYARGNPIRFKDPEGLWYKEFLWDNIVTLGHGQSWASFNGELGEAANQLSQDSPAWDYAFKHPGQAGAVVGVTSGFAAASAAGGVVLGAGFNATNATVGIINAYGWQQTAQSYLNYKATGSQSARNQATFDGVVSAAAALGTIQQRQALNILSAALTALQAALPSIVNSAPQHKP